MGDPLMVLYSVRLKGHLKYGPGWCQVWYPSLRPLRGASDMAWKVIATIEALFRFRLYWLKTYKVTNWIIFETPVTNTTTSHKSNTHNKLQKLGIIKCHDETAVKQQPWVVFRNTNDKNNYYGIKIDDRTYVYYNLVYRSYGISDVRGLNDFRESNHRL